MQPYHMQHAGRDTALFWLSPTYVQGKVSQSVGVSHSVCLVCVRAYCADKFLLRLQRASVLRLPHDVRLRGIQSITYVRVPYIQV